MLRNFLVRQHERGLLFKNGDFQKFLEPGKYRYFDILKHFHVEVYALSPPEFTHELEEFLLKTQPEVMQNYFTLIDVSSKQVGLLYKNNHLVDILPPNTRKLYWRGIIDIKVEIFDLEHSVDIDPKLASLLLNNKLEQRYCLTKEVIFVKEVPEYSIGLLYRNGQYIRTESPGIHAYWKFNDKLALHNVELRVQEIDVSGQDILTKDKVSIRINLNVNYMFKDALQAYSKLMEPIDHLYRTAQFGLRAMVATRTLDALLDDKNAIDSQLLEYVRTEIESFGIEIKSVGIRDVIVPGTIRILLNKVVEAEKVAQSNIIRRREETAATRSLLNTAKVMEDNPIAIRLKELEILEKLSEKIGKLSVSNGLDGLLRDLVKIKP